MNQLNPKIQAVTAFAPATCANLAVGFDILGLAFSEVGDHVRLTKRDDGKLVIQAIETNDTLPFDASKNTATVALRALCEQQGIDQGFSIEIKKGIPLSSGMGGSAASSVAALVACNAFLEKPLTLIELAEYALYGEEAASGQKHADNIVPCLFGGLTLIHSMNPLGVTPLPVPPLFCVLTHPHLHVSTQEARKILKKELPLTDYVKQSALLAAFIAALYQQDFSLLQKSYQDLLIEPQRASLIPGYYAAKNAALDAGALGFSLSGSGPSLLALAQTRAEAHTIQLAVQKALSLEKLEADAWISPIHPQGAHVTEIK